MKLRRPLIATFTAVLAGYMAYPCFTLYRLQTAITRGDAATLNTLVNWKSVRQGIESDLKQQQRDTLPMFGAGFMRRIAVKSAVTPAGVVTAIRERDAKPETASSGISSAWLEGPGRLIVAADGLRLQMQLGMDGWQVTRVWLPSSILRAAVREG